jgi:hypothetical protein
VRDTQYPPTVDLTHYGDGSAEVLAEIAGGIFEYPGVYKNEDGFVSGSCKIHNRDFYQFYSYVIKSTKSLDMYEQTLRELLHPLGLKYFAEVVTTMGGANVSMNVSFYSKNT